MTRIAVSMAWAILLVGCACTQEKGSDREANPAATSVQVDPMVFVMIYHANFENLLRKHADDCEGALAALMRFVADQRQAFLDKVRGQPPDWQPRQLRSHKSIELLMEFGASCPNQVARLNQAIHSVTQLADGS